MRTLVLAASLLVAGAALADRDVTHSFQSTAARGRVQRVVIDVPTGSFTIRNGSSDRLAVSGIASRDYDGEKERGWAQKVVNDTSVEIYVSGTEAIVRRKFGPNADSFRARKFTGLDLRIEVPAGVDVKFETTAGEIDMNGQYGHVDIDLRAGEVDLRMPKANVRELKASCRVGEVRTRIGDQITTREGVFPGTTSYFNAAGRSIVRVHTTAGEVRVTLQ
ncbi:MAG TPA: hypothetical protein VGF48_24740 [Thermoanaerobaculia bacterium]|jgi:hypothetical protein